jgi:hypothetical protein
MSLNGSRIAGTIVTLVIRLMARLGLQTSAAAGCGPRVYGARGERAAGVPGDDRCAIAAVVLDAAVRLRIRKLAAQLGPQVHGCAYAEKVWVSREIRYWTAKPIDSQTHSRGIRRLPSLITFDRESVTLRFVSLNANFEESS